MRFFGKILVGLAMTILGGAVIASFFWVVAATVYLSSNWGYLLIVVILTVLAYLSIFTRVTLGNMAAAVVSFATAITIWLFLPESRLIPALAIFGIINTILVFRNEVF